jgi:flavin-dependent dehydrogenase
MKSGMLAAEAAFEALNAAPAGGAVRRAEREREGEVVRFFLLCERAAVAFAFLCVVVSW